MAAADSTHEAEYFVPYFIHTPMEPPAAIVDANSSPVQIWACTQSPNQCRQYVAEALGVEKKDVRWVSAEKGTGIPELRSLVQSTLGLS